MLPAFTLLALSGCALFGQEDGAAGAVEVRAAPANTLLVHNGTDAPVHYFAVGAESRHLIEWYPSVTGPDVIPARAQRRVEVSGTEREDAVLYWWTAVPQACAGESPEGDDGPCYAPGPVEAIEVRR